MSERGTQWIAWTGIVVALVCALVGIARPASAYADTGSAQWPVTDTLDLQAVSVATKFWRDRGLTTCPDGVQVYLADGLDALGEGGNCQAWLNRQNLIGEESYLDAPTWIDFRAAARDICSMWTHEIGHALGLPHSHDGGVMDPMRRGMPYACTVWARELYPAPAHHRHRSHRRKHHRHHRHHH